MRTLVSMTLEVNKIINRTLALWLACFFLSCTDTVQVNELRGEAQGTTYSIKYLGEPLVSKAEVDSVLEVMDEDMNTWRSDSKISLINDFDRSDTVFAFYDKSKIWSVLWDMTWEIHRNTEGAFDPTVKPLVDLWGFGLKNVDSVDSSDVDSIMSFVGFRTDVIDLDEVENDSAYLQTNIWKAKPRAQLDFNAIAQGYSVDMIIDLLSEAGVKDAMVELGGEVRAMGVNASGLPWQIAVDKPIEGSSAADRELQAVVSLDGKGLCTSGNYRKSVEIDGFKRSHTIDPRTGYPVEHNLLSVTIRANSAAIADAYATACMVVGPEESKYIIEQRGLDALLIMSDENGGYEIWVSPGFEEEIKLLD